MKMENMDSVTSKPAEVSSQLFLAIKDLLLWRNCRLTLIVFTTVMVLLLDIMTHSVISVVSMAGIAVLLAAIAYRCFLQFLKWKKTGVQEDRSRLYPQVRIDIPREEVMRLAGITADYLNESLNRVTGLFLVESWEDSIKFLGILFALNLLGDCFNGLTLILLVPPLIARLTGHVLIFTLPKLYEWYQPLFDAQLQKFPIFKIADQKTPETETEDTENPPAENMPKGTYDGDKSSEVSLLYKVCNNKQLFDILEEEHRKGCPCHDYDHQDLPIEGQ